MTRLSAFDEARRDDLVYLRKGAGLTAVRLAKRPGLLHLVRQPTDPDRGAAVLREIVFHLSQEDATGEALASAYGFIREAQAPTLGQRRKTYAQLRGISTEVQPERLPLSGLW